MTAARVRLVDEAKGNTAGQRRDQAAPPRKKAARGPRAESERVQKPPEPPASSPRVRAGKRPCSVEDVMRSPAVCCQLSDTLHRAAQLMWEQDVGSVVVLDEQGKAVHLVTDRDVCMGAYTQGVALWSSPLTSLRLAPLVSCSPGAGLVEVRRSMEEHGVRRVPVVDADGSALGVVGIGDLVREATGAAPKGRTRGLTPPQLGQTLSAVYEDVPVPAERAASSRA